MLIDGPFVDHRHCEEVRAIAERVAATVPADVTAMHYLDYSEVTTEQLARFDREMRTAEMRCWDELAGFADDTIFAAIEWPEGAFEIRGADFLMWRTICIREVVSQNHEDRARRLATSALMSNSPHRVGYTHEDFQAARDVLPLEAKRLPSELQARSIEEAAKHLDRFDAMSG